MKLIILFALLGGLSVGQQTTNCDLMIILMNDHKMRPIATDENFFWRNKPFLDTLCSNSKRLFNFVDERRKGLTEYPESYQFTISAAILIKKDNLTDTLYADKFFRSWKIKGKNYEDNLGDFRRMFGNLFLFQYEK